MDETLSIKVPKTMKIQLQAIAKARKVKPSVLLREALDHVLAAQLSDMIHIVNWTLWKRTLVVL